MINVDGSPPLFLGAGMVVAGLILYQLRNSRPYITKDFDIVLSCIAIFAGGILIFQVNLHCANNQAEQHEKSCFGSVSVSETYAWLFRAGGWIHCCYLDSC